MRGGGVYVESYKRQGKDWSISREPVHRGAFMRRGVGSFPILVRLKRFRAAKRQEMFLPLFWGGPGACSPRSFSKYSTQIG